MNIATDNTDTHYSANGTDKGAIMRHDGLVIFGRWYRDEFLCSHAKPSRKYASRKSAERQIAKWFDA